MANSSVISPSVGKASAYFQRKSISLANTFHGQKKIYLDTKYWILLRDVATGRSKKPVEKELFKVLEGKVSEGIVVCPLQADTFFEFLKQDCAKSLHETAKVVDKFSRGLCLTPIDDRMAIEVQEFVEYYSNRATARTQVRDLVWTKPAYLLGFVCPNLVGMPEEFSSKLQNLIVDEFWEMTLEGMFDAMGLEEVAKSSSYFEDISSELNEGKFTHANEHSSFKGVFISEIQGVVEGLHDDFDRSLKYIYQQNTGKKLSSADVAFKGGGRGLAKIVVMAFERNKIKRHLPSVRIAAGLHAALRWDKVRKYKANDQFDFRHAIAALPYCDFFFTERSLCTLLKDKNLRFSDSFSCKSVYRPEEALSLLKKV